MLAWTDVKQGRLASFIRWMQLATNCFFELYESDCELQQFSGARNEIEKAFCNRLYTLNNEQIKQLVPYASKFRDMQLPMARFTVLYLAGLEKEIAEEFTQAFGENVEWMRSFFENWRLSVGNGFPETLLDEFGHTVQATGNVRDSLICLECDNDFSAITYSDVLLGTVEGLASHWVFDTLKAAEKLLQVKVILSEQDSLPPKITFQESTILSVRLCRNFSDWLSGHEEECIMHLKEVAIDVCCIAFGKSRGEIAIMIKSIVEKGTFNKGLDCLETQRKIIAMIGRDCFLLERT